MNAQPICKNILAGAAIFIIMLLAFCEKNPHKPEHKEPLFTGIVKDDNGAKLENVAVHFIYFNWPKLSKVAVVDSDSVIVDPIEIPTDYNLNQNYPNPFNPTTIISYALAQRSNVQLSIFNFPDYDTVAILVKSEQSPGQYSVIWDGRNTDNEIVANGLYPYRVKANDFENEKIMCVQMSEPETLGEVKARFYTDQNGKFKIPYKYIPVGKQINITDESGPEIIDKWIIPDFITIVLTKEGYESVQKIVEIDTTKYVEHDFVMIRK